MALFKTFRGKRTELHKVSKVDGHAYFCTDDGSFWIDYKDGEEVKRKQINKEDWNKDIEAAIAALIQELESENILYIFDGGDADVTLAVLDNTELE